MSNINLSVKQIKRYLPEVEEILIFYSSGLVYQCTFKPGSINVPKVGERLVKIIDSFQQLYDLLGYEIEGLPTIIFETEGVDMIIVKISEDVNLVLFFRAVIEDKGLQLDSPLVKKHMKNLRKLLDIGCVELAEKQLSDKVEELGKQYMDLVRLKLQKQQELDETLDEELLLLDQEEQEGEFDPEQIKKIDRTRKQIKQHIKDLEEDIDRKVKEIEELKETMGTTECIDE